LDDILPPEEENSCNSILEIRAGTGGDEASLFARDLFEMYENFARKKGWKYEMLNCSTTVVGGYKVLHLCFIVFLSSDIYVSAFFWLFCVATFLGCFWPTFLSVPVCDIYVFRSFLCSFEIVLVSSRHFCRSDIYVI